mgnify:CR=1 FL=1
MLQTKTRFRRGLAIVAVAVGLTGAAASSLAARSRPERAAERIVERVGADLSEAALQRLVAGDPALKALAARHDPAAPTLAELWARSPEADAYVLNDKPNLGLSRTIEGERAIRINASIPNAILAPSPAAPFVFRGDADSYRRALRCLTQAVYYEAAREPRPGQEAVAQVVLNRVRDPNFPNSVCGVVFQGAERTTGCQFSFTCDGSMAWAPERSYWTQAEDVARRALAGYVAAPVGGATHYHADYVYPWWGPSVAKIETIGRHVFYRWRDQPIGGVSNPSPLLAVYAGREPVIDEARFARPRVAEKHEQLAANSGLTAVQSDNGRVTVVTSTRPGGRRAASREEIARINAAIAAYEAGQRGGGAAPAAAETPPAPSDAAS